MQSNQVARKVVFNLTDHLEKGMYVDAKDIDGNWRLARIMERDERFVTVRYDAYEAKFEEQMYISSSRLAPLRRHTEGYTGLQRRTCRDFLLKLPVIIELRQKLQAIFDEKQQKPQVSAYSITQLLRGQVFVQVDSLLTFPCHLTQSQIRAIVLFLQYYVTFTIRFSGLCLKLATEHFQEFISNKQAYLTNYYVALLASLQQLLYGLMLIFMIRGQMRNQLYSISQNVKLEELEGQTLLENFKNQFVKMDGVSTLKKILMFRDGSGRGFPSAIRRSSLLILNHFGCLRGNNGIQLPSLEPKDFHEVFKLIPLYIDYFSKEETEVSIVEYCISLAIGNFPFDSKLRGINQLKSYVEKANSKEGRNPFRFLSEDKLADILKTWNFVDAITDPKTFNAQIFKRSAPMIKLLTEKRGFSNNNVTQIMRLAESRHESETANILSTVAEIANFAPTDTLDLIFTQAIKLKPSQMTINFLRDFSINAIDNISKQSSFLGFLRRKKASSRHDYYGLNHLWKEIQDDGNLEPKLIPTAIDAIKAMFSSESFKGLRDLYIGNCLENIKKKRSVGQSLKLLLAILQSFSTLKPFIMGQNRGDVVQRFDRKYQILQICSAAMNKNDFTKMPKTQCVEYFFQFLQEYNGSLRLGLRVQDVKNLWKVTDNQTDLLNFLRKAKHTEDKDYRKKLYKRLPPELIKDLFSQIFLLGQSMNNFYELSSQVYDTVDELFLAFHNESRNLEMNDKLTIRLLNFPLFGIQFYERMLLANKQSKQGVVPKCRKRYVELHLRNKQNGSDEASLQKKLKMWKTFLFRLLELLPQNKQTMLPTLYEFLKEIEGKMVRENVQHTGYLDIEVRHQNRDKIIRLPRNSSIFKLRKLIAKQFGLDITMDFKLQVCFSHKQVSFMEQQDFSVNAIETSSKGPSIRVQDLRGKHPHLYALELFKQEIASNQKIYTQLVELLGHNEQEVWDILELLPKNRKFYDKLENVETSFDKTRWRDFFGETSFKKLSYKLKMLSELIRNVSWVTGFQKTGGMMELTDRLMLLNPNDFASADNIKCIIIMFDTYFNCLLCLQNNTVANLQLLYTTLLKYISLPQKLTLPFINSLLRLLLKLHELKPELHSQLFCNWKDIERILTVACFDQQAYENEYFIMSFTDLFVSWTVSENRLKIIDFLVGILGAAKSQHYFRLVVGCLEKLTEDEWSKMTPESFEKVKSFPSEVFKKGIKEENEKDFNGVIYGALRLKSLLLLKKQCDAEDNQLTRILINQYLFHESQTALSNIQSKKNTLELYRLLEYLFDLNPESINQLADLLIGKLQKAQWRRNGIYDWLLEVEKSQRKAYCGLRNLRSTCYINCLLQQFYMIQPFRQAVLKLDTTKYNPVLKDNEMYQFQKILSFLKYSQKGSYNPKDFCQAFKDIEGKSIDVTLQSDVDEFFNAFMQKMENMLKVLSAPQIIDNVFRGTLSNQLVCQGCPHSSQREEQFLSLGVNIKNKNSLEEALKGYIQGEILDGDNAYFCQKCNKKVRTLKRLCIKQLPNILIIVMKRFEFNYDTMRKIKVNDYCSFPEELNMKKYTTEHFKEDPRYQPNEYYDYKLRGVIVHYGSSEAGHYYSYIRDQKNSWYEFNDDQIISFNPQDLPEETYGGSETYTPSDFEAVKSEKCKNAYLLFYERNANFDNSTSKPMSEMIKVDDIDGSDKPIMDLAKQDNSNFEFTNIVFDSAFIDFIKNIMQMQASLKAYQMCFIYFHTVLLRVKEKEDFLMAYGQRIEELLRKKEIADWYVSQWTKLFMKEFFIQAPKFIRYVMVGLGVVALKEATVIPETVVMNVMGFVMTERRTMTPFARLLEQMSKREPQKHIMEKYCYPQRVIATLTADNSNKFEQIPQNSEEVSFFGKSYVQKQKQKSYGGSVCNLSLIESLRHFTQSVTLQDLQAILTKTNDKLCRRIIGKMAVERLKCYDIQKLKQISLRITLKILHGEDKQLSNYLRWFRQLVFVKDEQETERIKLVVQRILHLMQQFEDFYYPFDEILITVIKLCKKNPIFQEQFKKRLQFDMPAQPNKHRSLIDSWIVKSGSANRQVHSQKWKAYKTKVSATLPETTSFYEQRRQRVQRDYDLYVKGKEEEIKPTDSIENKSEEIKKLQSEQQLIDRTMSEPFNHASQKIYRVKGISGHSVNVKVLGRAGLLYRVQVDGGLRWYVGDRDEYDFHNSLV